MFTLPPCPWRPLARAAILASLCLAATQARAHLELRIEPQVAAMAADGTITFHAIVQDSDQPDGALPPRPGTIPAPHWTFMLRDGTRLYSNDGIFPPTFTNPEDLPALRAWVADQLITVHAWIPGTPANDTVKLLVGPLASPPPVPRAPRIPGAGVGADQISGVSSFLFSSTNGPGSTGLPSSASSSSGPVQNSGYRPSSSSSSQASDRGGLPAGNAVPPTSVDPTGPGLGSTVITTLFEAGFAPPRVPSRHVCTWENCTKEYAQASWLKRHTDRHIRKQNMLACSRSECGKRFHSQTGLDRHMLSHNPNRSFPCPVADCGKSFKNNQDLIYHNKWHNNPNEFKCKEPGCTKKYMTRSGLKRHEKKQHGNRSESSSNPTPTPSLDLDEIPNFDHLETESDRDSVNPEAED